MKQTLAVLLLLIAIPAGAEDRKFDFTLWGTWIGIPGEQRFKGLDQLGNARIDFDTAFGLGAAVNTFWTSKVSTELSISRAKPRADLIVRVASDAIGIVHLGEVEIVPVSLVAQYHFSPARHFDWYLGGGGSYVFLQRTGTLTSGSVPTLTRFEFTNRPGLVLNGGISYRIGPRFAINGDVKVLPLRSSATATLESGRSRGRVVISPVIAAAGVAYRF